MFTKNLKRIARRIVIIAASTCAIAAVGANTAFAAPGGGGGPGGGSDPLACSIAPANGTATNGVPITFTASTSGGKGGKSYSWDFSSGQGDPISSSANPVDVTYNTNGTFDVLLAVTDKSGSANCSTTVKVSDGGGGTGGDPISRGDSYATPIGKTLNVAASRVSGVLYNDFDTDAGGGNIGNEGLTAVNLDTTGMDGTVNLNADGSFTYTPGVNAADNVVDTFTYQAEDADGNLSDPTTVAVQILADQPEYKMTMNYELGMHCTGFEFAYCCVLPPYNSIVAQITKPQSASPPASNGGPPPALSNGQADMYPRVLDATADPATKDGLGRETVLRDIDASGNFKRYQVKYYHDAQPRVEGQGKPQTSTLISDVEGNSLLYTNTRADSARIGNNGELVYGSYAGAAYGVWQGDGKFDAATDNYANAWLNHFYIYADLEGSNPDNSSLEADKIRLGVNGMVAYPKNVGAALQPMGPNGAPGTLNDGLCEGGDNAGLACTLDGTSGDDCSVGEVGGVCVSNGACFTKDPNDPEYDPTCTINFDNVLTFSTDTGTVVYTQMKVLENLPVMLTSPRMWEALGLPLTPFEDSIDFFGDPGAVDEDTIRPYVAMKGQLVDYPSGNAVISNGKPVIGFGTAPIDIPNCERCHSAPSINPDTDQPNVNSPNFVKAGDSFDETVTPTGLELEALTDLEYQFWVAYYGLLPGDSDWYARLKAAAINMMALHDSENGTNFTAAYPATECVDTDNCKGGPLTNETDIPQNTRLGFESVICQKCHADNVIAVVKSGCELPVSSDIAPLCQDASGGDNTQRKIIQPITEAIHWNHRGTDEGGVISFSDDLGRDGGCQGCHPAHRSDGVTDGYPITLDGDNYQANSDNRLAAGGCFVGRDVHSNPLKDVDGAETPEYLNAVGQWLKDTVARNQAGLAGSDADNRGIWCTNCHNQLSQELWRTENVYDLVNGRGICTDGVTTCESDRDCARGDSCALNNPRAASSLDAVAAAVGVSTEQAIAWLDPRDPDPQDPTAPAADFTHAIWNPDVTANPDANVATIEVSASSTGCGARFPFKLPRFDVYACLDFDGDPGGAVDGAGDPSVRILTFCTTPDCVAQAQAVLDSEGNGSIAAPVPFDAATDGRDHWLSPGEPHCADCHAAPFTEQSGNINAFPPFNYPRKASLMRYSRGHQDLTCQACHESAHGLYPVTPTIDSTTYAQAASLNPDGSHGPLKCATCHEVDGNGIPTWSDNKLFATYDEAVVWAHTLTQNNSVAACVKCHNDAGSDGGQRRLDKVSETQGKWLRHSYYGRIGRKLMDNVEVAALGHVSGDPDTDGDGQPDRDAEQIAATVCAACHSLNGGPSTGFLADATCDNEGWKSHLIQGRISGKVWEFISLTGPNTDGTTCGW